MWDKAEDPNGCVDAWFLYVGRGPSIESLHKDSAANMDQKTLAIIRYDRPSIIHRNRNIKLRFMCVLLNELRPFFLICHNVCAMI